jgi:hypothetical protein
MQDVTPGGDSAMPPGDTGADASRRDAAGGDSGDAAPPGAPACDPTKVWKTLMGIDPSIPSTGFGQFGGISRDELSVAWTTTSGVIQVADRPSSGGSFAAPVTVTAGSTALANDRVALSWTGLVLLAVSMDRSKLVELTRQSGGTTWTVTSGVDLAEVNALSTGGAAGFSQPVLGDDANTLYFMWTQSGQAPALYTSSWDKQMLAWSPPVQLPNTELASTDATHRRRPTGGSSDGRTLFFYDEVAGKERAAWRNSITSPFAQFVDIGALPEAAPNGACDTLYFQGVDTEAGGEGLGVAF